ncbi:MAG: squalene synthase HpnC [candidate division Zixibacteria bacterium]|nr:squalene synthase HpnC [candidate division Zixibacteria bacterium]
MTSSSFPLPVAARRLNGLALEALPGETPTLDEALTYCRTLATTHYENFTVVSFFLPRPLRSHFCALYAYCRWSDDLADETGDTQTSLDLLNWWENELLSCYAGHPRHPVFVALEDTVCRFDIPIAPFRDLLAAFRQDQKVRRYKCYDDLLAYCRCSANPVGRLVLYLCGYRDEERQRLSDATCTALQLANFWQDVTVDLKKDRIYIPLEDMDRFGYSEADLFDRRFDDRFAALMKFEVERARALFRTGFDLCPLVDRHVRLDIELFGRGGVAVLDRISRQGYDVLSRRPSLSKTDKLGLTLQYAVKRFIG